MSATASSPTPPPNLNDLSRQDPAHQPGRHRPERQSVLRSAATGSTPRTTCSPTAFATRSAASGGCPTARTMSVENGPQSNDRLAAILRGVNYGWTGTAGREGDADALTTRAIYNWTPTHAPVNIEFVEAGRFGGSGSPLASGGMHSSPRPGRTMRWGRRRAASASWNSISRRRNIAPERTDDLRRVSRRRAGHRSRLGRGSRRALLHRPLQGPQRLGSYRCRRQSSGAFATRAR